MRARDPSYRARARSLSRRATPRRHTARARSPPPLFPSALRSARALSARAPLARSTSRSFLSYGVGTVEESLRARLLSDAAGRPGAVENPCAFRGHEADAPGGARLVGTGDLPRCEAALRDVLWNGTCAAPPCGLGGEPTPALAGDALAMCVFFYALDTARACGPRGGGAALERWPRPTLGELAPAVAAFCAQDWADVRGCEHAYTPADVLPSRCVEAAFVLVLLRDAYGVPVASRQVEFALEVDGEEVEWTWGYVLAEVEARAAAAGARE